MPYRNGNRMTEEDLWKNCINSRSALKWKEWEKDFLEDLKDRKFSALSEKQRGIALELINKMDELGSS